MTTLTLTKGWLTLLTTGDTFGAYTDRDDRSLTFGIDGGVVNHAGGRQRSYSVEGEAGIMERTFVELTWDNITTLRSWEGELVLYRDWRPGLSMYGTFFGVTPIEIAEKQVWKAKITINLLTHLEGI